MIKPEQDSKVEKPHLLLPLNRKRKKTKNLHNTLQLNTMEENITVFTKKTSNNVVRSKLGFNHDTIYMFTKGDEIWAHFDSKPLRSVDEVTECNILLFITYWPVLGSRVPVTQGIKVGIEKSPWSGLPDNEMWMILRSLVLAQYQHVTDRQTRRLAMSHSSI